MAQLLLLMIEVSPQKARYPNFLYILLLIMGTKINMNKADDQLVSSIDILPAILTYIGIKTR